ncbi:hypothetical protein G9F73_018740 [Clostridium estertheticum]|uniref:hypothetical protein n=1 Tax=Clostridium estertheticum TaxID=238834 RepID=UPI0013EE94CE|nr:hypothetical protein [Clostridium estertheticum]MBZ9606436.1 hypothetical protein [Clostridium estertheticum]MBZ9606648.1 hypothetical protein [Clostridium estertheticum]MBZ9606845.1 hypothetical protein [Clostridium estertheticum]MBZ9606847.1 hypothetical protein [Clostridium estertheticum]MBZ9607006.1 hypothetical protein [Clostridium estertheticum]
MEAKANKIKLTKITGFPFTSYANINGRILAYPQKQFFSFNDISEGDALMHQKL